MEEDDPAGPVHVAVPLLGLTIQCDQAHRQPVQAVPNSQADDVRDREDVCERPFELANDKLYQPESVACVAGNVEKLIADDRASRSPSSR